MTNKEKLAIVLQLVNGLKANEWRRIKAIIDRQYEEKATKLALDDLSCESIEQLANHLHKALESTLGTSSKTFKELSDDMDKKQKVDLIVLAISIAALLVACGALSVSLYMLNS